MKSVYRRVHALEMFIVFVLLCLPSVSLARTGKCVDEGLVSRGSVALAGYEQQANVLASDTLLVPASVLKIATSLAALEIFGPSHRFITEFFLDTTTLYVRGQGDPFLVSEEVDALFRTLASMGVTKINDIVFDDSAFSLEKSSPNGAEETLNPYDAANGALAVNFNTMQVEVRGSTVHSAEPQTPTIPLMAELSRGLPHGIHRVNITAREHKKEKMLRYAGELFRAMQHKHGITGSGFIRHGRVPDGLPVLYAHRSGKTIAQAVRALLLYSNNFVANQLFLTMGMKRFGRPATWDKGKRAMLEVLQKRAGVLINELVLEEGAGLSRKNRITAQALLKVLEAFRPWHTLLPRESGAWVKSGTLTGVYSYAGFLEKEQGLMPFVIMLNQKRNTRDQILKQLKGCL